MTSTQNTIRVDLGALRRVVDSRVESGTYATPDEVIRAGLLALEREEAGLNEWLTRLAEEALADPKPSIPSAQVFRELRAKYSRPSGETTP
jgi:antitoxin ParD1/3/4